MTDRAETGEPRVALERSLERSLREGPPDERGYRAERVDFSTDAHVEPRLGLRGGPSSVRLRHRSSGTTPVFALLDSVALLLVVVLAGFVLLQRSPGGPGGSPPPTERTSASPIPVPPLTKTFVSTRNGFSVRYPAGWSTKAATTSWLPNTFVPIGNSALDELKLQGVARLVVASQRLEAGQTEASWIASSFGQQYYLQRCIGDPAAWPRVTVDGRSGYLDLNACPLSADAKFSTPDVAFDVIVFAADRVYRIGLDGVVDLGYFETILATVRLDPASAIDP